MATKLYFHNATRVWPPIGTFPSTEQSASAATNTATGANTLRTMNIFKGTTQSSLTVTQTSTTAAQTAFMGFFCSPPLQGAQTVGGGTMILFTADAESNTNANFWINGVNIYVWRPSTGTKVGTVKEQVTTSLGGTEATAANSEQVTYITGITSTAVSAADGDVVICEIWNSSTQAMATAGITATLYFDGTTESTTENAAIASAASYIQLTENLNFKTGPRSFAVFVS